jgi:hypothetical protein
MQEACFLARFIFFQMVDIAHAQSGQKQNGREETRKKIPHQNRLIL